MCRPSASLRPDPAASPSEAVGCAGLAVWPRAVDCPAVVVCGVCEVCDNRTSGTRSVAANQENCIVRLIILSILSGNLLQAAKIANQPDIHSRRHKQFLCAGNSDLCQFQPGDPGRLQVRHVDHRKPISMPTMMPMYAMRPRDA